MSQLTRTINRMAPGLFLLASLIFLVSFESPALAFADQDDPTVKTEAAFQRLDKDSGGTINQEEFLASVSEANRPKANRNFRLVDFDGNNQLSLEEYRCIPGVLPTDKRGPIPDPAREFAQTALEKWKVLLQAADADQDKQLSQEEWPVTAIKDQLPPFEAIEFALWDADRNGQVNDTEAEAVFAVAYGLHNPAGLPMRLPNGVQLYWSYISDADKNKDGMLSQEEFVATFWGKGKNLERFQEIDTNQDGQLSHAEMLASRALQVDAVSGFLAFDKDLDARLSLEEMQKISSGASPRNIELSLAAFDDDGDGLLTFQEFRWSPAGYAYVTARLFGRVRDLDHDGQLSWSEFQRDKTPFLMGLNWEVFQRYDRNHDGSLQLAELEFPIDLNKVPVEIVFQAKDVDHKGWISTDDYLKGHAESRHPRMLRDFRLADFDGDEQLTLEEYRCIPGVLPADKRGQIPDPAQEFAAAALKRWQTLLKESDRDQDDQISRLEWPHAGFRLQLPPFDRVDFANWDLDRNGQVNAAEAEALFARAYGISNLTGQPLRLPNGIQLFWSYINDADKNKDGVLSQEEFVATFWRKEKNLDHFREMDTDQDGELSHPEMLSAKLLQVDTWVAFIALDKDLDGRLSEDELRSNSSGGAGRNVGLSLAAFDDDDDKHFSYREYRLSPSGIGYVAFRVFGRVRDRNADGQVSWAEFPKGEPPFLLGLAWEVFRRYDRNHDSVLSYDEFDFPVDINRAPPELVFRVKDKNGDGLLEFLEVFDEPRPSSEQPREFGRYQFRMTKAEEKFLQNDLDKSGEMDLQEFTTSRNAVQGIANRYQVQNGQLAAVSDSSWVMPAFLTFDALLLLGVGWFVLRGKW